jgi:protein CpxP
MKKLIIVLVFGIGISGFAQETTLQDKKSNKEKMTLEQRQEKQLQKLTTELQLNENQQKEVAKILSEKSTKAEGIKEQKGTRKANGEKMTEEERAAFKTAMQAEKEDTEAKMKSILTEDQYKKWLTLREENKEKMKEKRRGGM